MLIINADDWGGWPTATDAILPALRGGRVSSVSAMVFMEDSERAARMAGELGADAGLHLNFNQTLSGGKVPGSVARSHTRIQRFLKRSKYAQLFYHPGLRGDLRVVYEAQVEEFGRLYGGRPSHFDGHQHMHLCMNMILNPLVPSGEIVRKSFSFSPGQKSRVNRLFRSWVDRRLARRYATTDYFFSLPQCLRFGTLPQVLDLARQAAVELMVHPEKGGELDYLTGQEFGRLLQGVTVEKYRALAA